MSSQRFANCTSQREACERLGLPLKSWLLGKLWGNPDLHLSLPRVKICGAVKKEPSLERPQGSASKATLSVCPCGPGRTGSLQCGHHKRGEGIQRLGRVAGHPPHEHMLAFFNNSPGSHRSTRDLSLFSCRSSAWPVPSWPV